MVIQEASPVRIYDELLQGSDEWRRLRAGLITSSEMDMFITPKTLKGAANDKERAHIYQLAADRVTDWLEESYESWDMQRGKAEEIEARRYYESNYGRVRQVGFIVNTRHGFPMGYSPDGLVGRDGQIEIKSRRKGLQMRVLLENIASDTVPVENVIQVQHGLIVSERRWCDYVAFSNGMHMGTVRAHADATIQAAIIEVAQDVEQRIRKQVQTFKDLLDTPARLVPTKRVMFTEELDFSE